MIQLSIEAVVMAFVYLLGIALIFGALFWLVGYLEGQLPTDLPVYKGIRIFMAVCAVLILIGFVLSLRGHPIIHIH